MSHQRNVYDPAYRATLTDLGHYREEHLESLRERQARLEQTARDAEAEEARLGLDELREKSQRNRRGGV